ncbi:DUF892 family protein [Micromonospora chersina]|uniref:DUF892 family protein n=1 Tax=Micromonospora chersina TaxID=47854 RepID=UPI003718855A
MAIDTTRDLFIYELGILGEMESSGLMMFNFLAHRVTADDLRQIVETEHRECKRREQNINSCAEAIGTSLLATRSSAVEGIYGRFEGFVRLDPSPNMLDQFAVDTMIRFLHITVAAHKTLVDWAIIMGENQCVQCLHTNLVEKQESLAKLERYGHELGTKLLAPAARRA